MTAFRENKFPFLATINTASTEEVALWAQKLSVSEVELRRIIAIAGPVVKDIHDYLQTLKPATTAYTPYERLISDYKSFLQQTISAYLHDYAAYRQGGGKASFYKWCWHLLLDETMEEAHRVVEANHRHVPDAHRLTADLQQAADEALLNIDTGNLH